jgi:kynurenine formamidase
MADRGSPGGGAAPSPAIRVSEAEFCSLYEALKRARRWGEGDRRGAMNYLTPAETLAATREVRLGRAVSLAAPIEGQVTADNPDPARHQLRQSSEESDQGVTFNLDRIDMNIHGNADTHIDALCHVIFDGELYNGVPAVVDSEVGGVELSIGIVAEGIVGRGVLLDVPRSRGVPWLEPGDHVTVDDVLAAERDQGVQIGRGDIVLVRVGHRERRREHGPWDAAKLRAGLHPEVVPWLAERQVAVLGSDGNGDTAPSLTDGVDFPVHVLAVNALGMMLLDYLELGVLAPLCEETTRWSFLCVVAPLRLPRGTGSPVNPIAVL